MRAACRKLLKFYNEGGVLSQRKQGKFLFDFNDLNDFQTYLAISNSKFPTSTGGLQTCSSSCCGVRQLFRTVDTDTYRIAAHWMEKESQYQKDAAYGSILGAFVGDATGGVLEFLECVNEQQVLDALRMPGGGVWSLGPGQITDDSEMALCLLRGLLGTPGSAPLPLDSIARWYIKWLNSSPFDIGQTTRQALSLGGLAAAEAEGLGARMVANAKRHNQQSLSNGCLMRVAPLAVWGHMQPVHQLAQLVQEETALTHPNKTAQVGTAAYCIAIAHLISHPRDASGAITAVTTWLSQQLGHGRHLTHPQQHGGAEQQVNACQLQLQQQELLVTADAAAVVLDWLSEAQRPGPGPDVQHMMGFMRWGFVHAFRALHRGLSFSEAIKQIITLGGDTDTNAAIAGGLMGAYWGAAAIPSSLSEPVLSFGRNGGGITRPSFLHAGQLPHLFEQLWMDAQR